MNAQTSLLHIRVDDETKAQATEALAEMGMSVSEAVLFFLRRVVVEQAFPLELKVPNAETRAAMEESRAMMSTRRARFATAPPCSMTSKRAAASKRSPAAARIGLRQVFPQG